MSSRRRGPRVGRAAAQGWRAATGRATRDHRDRFVALYRPSIWDYVNGAAADFPRRELDRIVMALRRIDARELRRRRSAMAWRSLVTLACGSVVLALSGSVLIATAPPAVASAWPLAAIAAMFLFATTLAATITNWRTGATRGRWDAAPEEVATAMLAIARCPTCAQRLHGLPAEGDGCTVCPECGAAWNLGEEGAEARPPASHEGTEG